MISQTDNSIAADVYLFLESCNLPEKRLAALKRNLAAAFADGCCCADIIQSHFPKMISRHNYNEASSSQGRTANWNLLNKKVLQKLRLELDSNIIDTFTNRYFLYWIVLP